MKPIFAAVAPTVYDQETDNNLWSAFQQGDKNAYAAIYHRYFDVLIQNCIRVSGDREMIKDCIHDLFVEMWKNKLNLAIPTSVKAYLYISIRRKVIRQVKKTRMLLSGKAFDQLENHNIDHSIEKKIIAQQQQLAQQQTIFTALNTLTKRQKEAVYLKFYANLSYPEIAGKMLISTDSIYNLVSKAIDNMQHELTKISLQ